MSAVSHREVHPCAERKLQMTNVAKLATLEGPTFLDYVPHELANVFEMIKGKEFEELCIDIKANGIHTPRGLFASPNYQRLNVIRPFRQSVAHFAFVSCAIINSGNASLVSANVI
jgi:hypothetical protein